jgi:hypothetical protein
LIVVFITGSINGDYSSNSRQNHSHTNNTYQGITTLPGGTLKPETNNNNNINVEISVQNKSNYGKNDKDILS